MKPAAILTILWVGTAAFGQAPREKTLPVSGVAVPDLKGFDDAVLKILKKHKLPGDVLAVTKDGRLVYARGFGYADREKETPMQPDALFRLASNSKPFTAAGILQLVDRGKLKLTDKVFPLLKLQPVLEPGKEFDAWWKTITVKHLLDHKGGFDYEKFGDPVYMPFRIADALKVDSPPRPEHIIRFMLGQTLDYDPGTEMHYSNFGYLILGRVIESVTKAKYDDYIRENVLKPIGITRMKIGRTLEADRFPDEVKYYELGWGPAKSVFNRTDNVPPPYGAWSVETMDSHSGWIALPVEMTRFLSALAEPDKFPRCVVRAYKHTLKRAVTTPVDSTGLPQSGSGWIRGTSFMRQCSTARTDSP